MINTSGLWALRVVSSCLVPGPGLAKAGEYGLRHAGQVEEIQLVNQHKAYPLRTDQLPEGQSLSNQKVSFRMSKHRNTQKI